MSVKNSSKSKNLVPKIVCIGGGTGTFVVLKGLKQYQNQLSAIVTMSDSGGSNKRIRDEFGLLPTSDIRQCLVALSDENGGVGLLRKLFMYRFERGSGIRGMTFGNLFMAALSDILGSQKEAIRQTGRVLRIRGSIIPVSLTDTNLFAEYEDGSILNEEHLIDEPTHDGTLAIKKVYLKPVARANPDALVAIAKADLIVLGPGDLYTSLIPNLLVQGVGDAIAASKAKKVFVMNLMTKYGQTYNYTAADHVSVVEKHIGTHIDYVIVNQATIPKKALEIYAKYHEQPVVNNLVNTSKTQVIGESIISRQFTLKAKSDTLIRSLIRHDSAQLAKVLMQTLQKI